MGSQVVFSRFNKNFSKACTKWQK